MSDKPAVQEAIETLAEAVEAEAHAKAGAGMTDSSTTLRTRLQIATLFCVVLIVLLAGSMTVNAFFSRDYLSGINEKMAGFTTAIGEIKKNQDDQNKAQSDMKTDMKVGLTRIEGKIDTLSVRVDRDENALDHLRSQQKGTP